MKNTGLQDSQAPLAWGLILLSLFLPGLVFADGPSQCFYLDGSTASNRSATTHSSCCHIGSPVNSQDICTTQGLCLWQGASNSQQFLFQDGCTDSSLKDASCRAPCVPITPSNGLYASKIRPRLLIACRNYIFCPDPLFQRTLVLQRRRDCWLL
jgi:hypothetical protein